MQSQLISIGTLLLHLRIRHPLFAAMIASCVIPTLAHANDPDTDRAKPLPPPVFIKTPTGVEVEVGFAGTTYIEANMEYTSLPDNVLLAVVSVPASLVMAVANPLYIFAPAVGIAAVPMGQKFRHQYEAVTVALDPATFGSAIADAMVENLKAVSNISAGTRYSFSIISYGLDARDSIPEAFDASQDVCLFVRGTLSVQPTEGTAGKHSFEMTRSNRSQGLPPPTCEPFDRFASNNGQSLRAALSEAAYLVGTWSAQAGMHQ